MNRSPLHIPVIAAMAVILALMASGCSSRKTTVRGSDGYTRGGSQRTETSATPPRDYSYEVPDAMGLDLVGEARRWLGTPYRYGGQDHDGTDCSGLVMEVYRKVCLVKLPRTTRTQKSYCLEIARNKARAGDLFFFGSSADGGSDISHVGLYIGGGEMIHASSSRGVMVSPVDTGYWGQRFRGVGRVGGASESWASAHSRPNTPQPSASPAPILASQPSQSSQNSQISQSSHNSQIAQSSRSSQASTQTLNPTPSRSTPEITLSEFAALSASKAAQSADTPALSAANASPRPAETTASLDLLDQLINEKIDSIFSTRFMD